MTRAVLLLALLAQDPKAPVPPVAEQKKAEKVLRDTFKEDYASRDRAARRDFAIRLISDAGDAGTDGVSRYVMLRDARDFAAEALDLSTAFMAIDKQGRFFDINWEESRNTALAAARKKVISSADATALAGSCLKTLPECAKRGDFDGAARLAKEAEGLARGAKEATLAVRAVEATRELPELRKEYEGFAKAELTLSLNADDPEANLLYGRYLCFVKGDWEKGLPCLAKTKVPGLAEAARKEIEKPATPEAKVFAGEAWAALGEGEKQLLLRKRYFVRASYWLEAALEGATGLLRSRAERRLDEMAAKSGVPRVVNLLRLIDPKADPQGEWGWEDQALYCLPAEPSRLMIPYSPPDEYDLTAVIERKQGTDAIDFGMVHGTAQFCVVIDGFSGEGYRSGLEMMDGLNVTRFPGVTVGPQIAPGKPVTVSISVRKSGILGAVDGRTFVNWKGNFNLLTTNAVFRVTDPKALFLGAWGCKWSISKLTLTPVSGEGKRLR